jgi:hypothetical protein
VGIVTVFPVKIALWLSLSKEEEVPVFENAIWVIVAPVTTKLTYANGSAESLAPEVIFGFPK